MARGVDPLRLLIVIAITAAIAVRLTYWFTDDSRPAVERPTGTASISGIVQDDAGAPVGDARVQAVHRAATFTTSVRTDAAGRFTLASLPEGGYRLTADKLGYVGDRGNYMLRMRFEIPARTVEVAAGAAHDGVVVPVLRGAAIAGVVHDENGAPAARRYVRVLIQDPLFEEVSWRDAAPVGATDDRGRFRIGGLPPGDYVVMAGLTTDGERRVYYPNAARVSEASPVTLAAGEERTNVNLRAAPPGPTAAVSGIVRREDGATVPGVRVDLVKRRGYEPDDRRRFVTTNADGTFAFADVQRDDYLVVAHTQAGDGWPDAPARVHMWAAADVTSNGREAAAASLTLRPGQMVRGRVTFAAISGAQPVALEQAPVRLIAADTATQAVLQTGNRIQAPVDADGRFTFAGVPPGRYRLTPIVVTEPWSVESATVGGVDVLDATLTIQRGTPPPEPEIVVTLTDRTAQVAGTLHDAAGQPVADRLVVAYPAAPDLWDGPPRRLQVATTDGSGSFVLDQLRGGDYLVGARPVGVTRHSRALFERMAATAVRVTLAPGEKRRQDLRVH